MSKAEERKQAVMRALVHHETTRAVHTWGTPVGPNEPWRVSFPDARSVELKTIGEVEALCAGLAAGEQRWKEQT